MNNFFTLANRVGFARICFCAASLLFASIAASASADSAYPGEIKDKHAQVILSSAIVQIGAQAYYKVHGEWADDWATIVEYGLWQTAIPSKTGAHVNPDDQSIDFKDDVYYFAGLMPGSANPSVMTGNAPDSTHLQTIDIQTPTTLGEFFERMEPYLEDSLDSRYSNDVEYKRLFAILGEVSTMCSVFYTVHQRWPSSLDEFLSSGLSPIDRTSINPVTGEAFHFDGSAGDVEIFFTENGPHIRHFERDGSEPANSFSYF